MKKILRLLMAVLIVSLIGLCACGGPAQGHPPHGQGGQSGEEQPDPFEGITLKILGIGNSYTLDTLQYFEDIAKDLGVQTEIVTLTIGGCTLDMHYERAVGDIGEYEYRTNSGSEWTNFTKDYKLSDAIKQEEWDYIMLQQASGSCGNAATYSHLDDLLEIFRGWAWEGAQFIWNMTWTYSKDSTNAEFYKYKYSQDFMYQQIVGTQISLIYSRMGKDFSVFNPANTAIHNARSSFLGDTLNSDGTHLTPLGRYIAGMALFKSITGKSVDDIKYIPSYEIDERMRLVAIESVNNAVANPFSVIQSKYL